MSSIDLLGHVEVAETKPNHFIVSVRGPMDGRVAGEFRDLLIPVVAADQATVVLDLVDAHCLDEEAISAVSVAAHLALGRGSRLRLATGSGAILELLHDRGLHELVTIDATVRQALARG